MLRNVITWVSEVAVDVAGLSGSFASVSSPPGSVCGGAWGSVAPTAFSTKPEISSHPDSAVATSRAATHN
jgi:hypothetical protein